MSASVLRCSIEDAVWSREQDCVRLVAHDGIGVVIVSITRAGLAALVAKDRSEISAGEAMELLHAHSAQVIAAVEASYVRKPRTTVIIDYAEIEEAR